MKRRWYRLLLIIISVLALIALGTFVYLQQPLFGRLPEGKELSVIERSPNYDGHVFRNQIDTPINTTDQSELSMWAETIFGREKGYPRPAGAMPAEKTNLKSLDRNQDLVIWLGHSSYFVQLSGQRILIDPVFSVNAAPLPGANVAFDGTSIYSAEDLPAIDLLLISHDHYDHLDYPTAIAIRDKVEQVGVGLGVGAHFRAWGYDPERIHELDWNDSIGLQGNTRIYATPARHFSGRTLTRDKSLWVGYALISPQKRIFFSGDSGYGPHFADIGKRYGPFDWVALDTGQYDPRWANVHMNPEQAAQAALDVGARALTPGHVGRFSLAPHDWNDPLVRITAASRGRNYALWTPIIGQPVYLDGRAQTFGRWWE